MEWEGGVVKVGWEVEEGRWSGEGGVGGRGGKVEW